MTANLRLLKKARCRLLDRVSGQPVAGVVVSLAVGIDGTGPRIPVGTLKSDATGYLAFDLQPLVELGMETATSLYVSSVQVGLKNYDLLASLAHAAGGSRGEADGRSFQPEASLDDVKLGTQKSLCMEFPLHVDTSKVNDARCDARCDSTQLSSIQCPDICDY